MSAYGRSSSIGRTLIACWRRKWSARVSSTIASTMGTARGSTHGSWRPLAARVVSSPSLVTVFCSLAIVAVGLNATRVKMFSPLEIPPWMPPDLLLAVLVRPVRGFEGIVVSQSGHLRACETAADLDAFGRGKRHQSTGEVGVEFVEHRLSQTGCDPAGNAGDGSPQGVAGASGVLDRFAHQSCGGRVRAAGRVVLDVFEAHCGIVDFGVYVSDALHPTEDLDSSCRLQQSASNRACGYPTDRFTR